MEIFAVAIMFVGGIWGAIYLILNGHPWFGVFVLIITASLRYSSRRTPDAPDGWNRAPENLQPPSKVSPPAPPSPKATRR